MIKQKQGTVRLVCLLTLMMLTSRISTAQHQAEPLQVRNKAVFTQEQYKAIEMAVGNLLRTIQKPEQTPPPDWAVKVYDQYTADIVKHVEAALVSGDWILIAEAYLLVKDYNLYDRVPALTDEQKREMIAHLRGLQDVQSGLFTNPHIKGKYDGHRSILRLLYHHGGQPLYPEYRFDIHEIPAKGMPEGIEPGRYLEIIQDGQRWQRDPWGVGSWTGHMSYGLMQAINDYGREELIPTLEQGINNIISYLDPKTGLFDGGDLMHRMSGCLKEWVRLYGYMGMEIPMRRRLANSLISNHKNGNWWKIDDVCLCRNIAILSQFCLEQSDYRRDELYDVIYKVAETAANRFPAGEGRDKFPKEFHIQPIGVAWNILNWAGPGLRHKHGNDFITNRGLGYRYKIVLLDDNTVKIVKKKPEEFPWDKDFRWPRK